MAAARPSTAPPPAPPPAVSPASQPGSAEAGQMSTAAVARGLIVHKDLAVQRAVGVILERCGYQVLVSADFAPEAVSVAAASRPEAVVVDLALSGDLGLQMIPAFVQASPGCMVVVLSPFTSLQQPARELGALSLVDPRDLRHVEDWLRFGKDPNHPCR